MSHSPRPIEASEQGPMSSLAPDNPVCLGFVNFNLLRSLPRRVYSNSVTSALNFRDSCAMSTKYSSG